MKLYIVVDTGCIECGEDTKILGVYRTREEAEQKHQLGDYYNRGEHCIEIFEAEIQ
jgi:hypothetical protein